MVNYHKMITQVSNNMPEVVADKTMWSGISTSILSGVMGLTITEVSAIISMIGVFIGIVLGVLGYIIKREKHKIEKEKWELEKHRIERELGLRND